VDGKGEALFRREDTRLDAGQHAEGLPVRIIEIHGRGSLRFVECTALGGQRVTAEVPESAAGQFEVGQRVRLTVRRVVLGDPRASRPIEKPAEPVRLGPAAGAA
jgi:hypothetical protein